MLIIILHWMEAANTVDTIKSFGARAQAIKADVGNEEEVLQMFEEIMQNNHRLDILINNSGIQKDAPLIQMSLNDWNQVIRTNLTAQFLCTREAIKQFLKQEKLENTMSIGKIICMSFVHDTIPWSGHANYSASKDGVIMFMKSIAQEYASSKIRVNAISPGAIKTQINKSIWESEEAQSDLLNLIQYKRVGDPQDIAKAALWLSSDESENINGTTIYVDGGMTLYPGFELGG